MSKIAHVAESLDPVTTMGGVRILPDTVLDELDPAASDLLVLPGADLEGVFHRADPAAFGDLLQSAGPR